MSTPSLTDSFQRTHSPRLDQIASNTTNTSDENMPREEPYDGTEAQFAEDVKDNTSNDG